MSTNATASVVTQAPHGLMMSHPVLEQMQMHMGLAIAADPMLQQHHNNAEAGRISYDTNEDMGQPIPHHSSSGGGGSALLGRKHAPDRRPLRFWQPFNDWWRAELERLGRRPTSQEIGEWYGQSAEIVWGDSKPSLQETRVHAKCLRSLPLVRDYFRNYRAKKKAKNGDGSGLDNTEDGGDTEDGIDNATGRRRRNSRKREYGMPSQDNMTDAEKVAAAMAAAGMAGMDPMDIMQMQQQAGVMLPSQLWAAAEGCTEEDYARAMMMQQQMHTVLLQQQMAAAAAAVAAHQFSGHQFGMFPAHDEDDDEDTDNEDAAIAAASAPADADAPDIVAGIPVLNAVAAQHGQQHQQQLEKHGPPSLPRDSRQHVAACSAGLDSIFARQQDESAALMLAEAAAAAAAAGNLQEMQRKDDAIQGAGMHEQEQQRPQRLQRPRTEEFDAAAVAAAAAAVAAAAEAAAAAATQPASASTQPPGDEDTEHVEKEVEQGPGVHCSMELSVVASRPNSQSKSPQKLFKAAEVQDAAMADAAVMQEFGCAVAVMLADPLAGAEKAHAAKTEMQHSMQNDEEVQPQQQQQRQGGLPTDGVVTEHPALSSAPQQPPQHTALQSETPHVAENEVPLLNDEQLQGLNKELLLGHIKQVQEELCSKRELLKRSFDQLRRTQERLARRERKVAKEQAKCRQYQQALAAWQASLVPACAVADPQMQQQELFSAHIAQMAMAAQAAAAQGNATQQPQ